MENSLVVVIQERFRFNVLMFSMLNYCGLGFQDKKSMPSKTCVMLHTDNSAMCMNFVWKLLPIWDGLIVPRNRSGIHKVISWRRVLFGITFYFVLAALTCPTYVFTGGCNSHKSVRQSIATSATKPADGRCIPLPAALLRAASDTSRVRTSLDEPWHGICGITTPEP